MKAMSSYRNAIARPRSESALEVGMGQKNGWREKKSVIAVYVISESSCHHGVGTSRYHH